MNLFCDVCGRQLRDGEDYLFGIGGPPSAGPSRICPDCAYVVGARKLERHYEFDEQAKSAMHQKLDDLIQIANAPAPPGL